MPHSASPGIPAVAAAVLTGLGKRPDLTMLKRPAEPLAAAWLTQGAATDVLILAAQKTSGWLLPEVLVWLCGLGVRPWVIFTTVDDPPHSTLSELTSVASELAEDWGVEVVNESFLRAAFPDVEAQPSAATLTSGLPVLPRCDGVVFRSTCQRLLDIDDAEAVDQVFVAAVKTIRADVEVAIREPDRQKSRLVARELRSVLEEGRDTEEIVLLARAAQVGVLPLGFLLTVDVVQLTAAAETRPRRGKPETGASWAKLDEYRDPDFGAATALHQAGAPTDEIAAVTLADIDDADGSMKVLGRSIPEPGARFVRTLVTFHHFSGGVSTTHLFSTHRLDQIQPAFAGRMIKTPTTENDVAATDLGFGRKTPTDTEWLRRYGLKVTHLDKIAKVAS